MAEINIHKTREEVEKRLEKILFSEFALGLEDNIPNNTDPILKLRNLLQKEFHVFLRGQDLASCKNGQDIVTLIILAQKKTDNLNDSMSGVATLTGGAIVGGALFGPVGAILGGLSALGFVGAKNYLKGEGKQDE